MYDVASSFAALDYVGSILLDTDYGRADLILLAFSMHGVDF
jgi:hypothetical protein